MKQIIFLFLFNTIFIVASPQNLLNKILSISLNQEPQKILEAINEIEAECFKSNNDTILSFYYGIKGIAFSESQQQVDSAIFYLDNARIIQEKINFINPNYYHIGRRLLDCYLEKQDFKSIDKISRWIISRNSYMIEKDKNAPKIFWFWGLASARLGDYATVRIIQEKGHEIAKTIYTPCDWMYYQNYVHLCLFYIRYNISIDKAKDVLDKMEFFYKSCSLESSERTYIRETLDNIKQEIQNYSRHED